MEIEGGGEEHKKVRKEGRRKKGRISNNGRKVEG
jgi:hypothetical protein